MNIPKLLNKRNLSIVFVVAGFVVAIGLSLKTVQVASLYTFSDLEVYLYKKTVHNPRVYNDKSVITAKTEYVESNKKGEVLGVKTEKAKQSIFLNIPKTFWKQVTSSEKQVDNSQGEVLGVKNTSNKNTELGVEKNSIPLKSVKFYISGKEIVKPFSNYAKCMRISESPFCNEQYAYFENDCLLKELNKTDFIKNANKTYILQGAGKKVKLTKSDIKINIPQLMLLMNAELKRRYNTCNPLKSFKSLYIQVPVNTNAPNTDGKVSNIYLEADGSRQLMFLWENGKYSVFKMSGAYTAWNPVGVYKFFYKSERAWSKYTGTWMPYWMAFTRDAKQDNALLGVHGLIYWCPNRTKFCNPKDYTYETEEHLGVQRSRGCLRLGPQDIKLVYSKIKVGDYIVVHD